MHSGAIFTATLRIFVDDILGADQVNDLLGRQVLVTPTVGSDTCEPRRTLNPAFVEALMGWPTGLSVVR